MLVRVLFVSKSVLCVGEGGVLCVGKSVICQ